MSKQTRSVQEYYEVCDICGKAFNGFEQITATWPVLDPEIATAGLLNKFKILLLNWYGEPSYHIHTKCAHDVLSAEIVRLNKSRQKEAKS